MANLNDMTRDEFIAHMTAMDYDSIAALHGTLDPFHEATRLQYCLQVIQGAIDKINAVSTIAEIRDTFHNLLIWVGNKRIIEAQLNALRTSVRTHQGSTL